MPKNDAENATANSSNAGDFWKILIVDDEKAVHDVTKLVLKNLIFQGKQLVFLSALTAAEAKQFISTQPDIAVILLDVVMETNDAGLSFAQYVREELKNNFVRIILRTGQPGAAPESKVITEYDINDYREKTELTSQKLHTVIIAALRSYQELQDLKKEKNHIQEESQQSLNERDKYLKILADSLPVLISFMDKEQKIRFYNKVYEVWFNKSEQEISKLAIKDLLEREVYEQFQDYWRQAEKNTPVNFDMRLNHYLLGSRQANVTLVPYVINDEFQGCFSLISDITEKKQMEQNIDYLASHDILTGLYNRVYFLNQLDSALAKAKNNKTHLAILFLDLDNFKKINDSLGHDNGDKLLLMFAGRLNNDLRKNDIVARFGGDKFVIMLESVNDQKTISATTDKIIKSFLEPFSISSYTIITSASIGISIFPDAGITRNELINNAELAMYSAKKNGKNEYQYYSESLAQAKQESLHLENDLKSALANKEFELFYQPIFDLHNNKVVSIEALIRWHHPKHGLLLPFAFLPAAEEIGLMEEVTKWVLTTACQQLVELHNLGFADLKCSVNIPPKHFCSPHFVQLIKQTLMAAGLTGKYLQLELTENAMILNMEIAVINIEKLEALDVEILLDDFGCGVSNLNYLKNMAIKAVKLDKSFTQSATTDLRSAAIISNINRLAHQLAIKTVVKAVETESQLKFVASCQCDMVQGFYLAKPVPFNDLKDMLNKIG